MTGIRQPLQVMDVKDPELFSHGAIVRVEASGICRSDWHAWTGDWTWFGLSLSFPHVLGHECCGVVEEVSPECSQVRPGDRVLVPFSQGEGSCEYCRAGQQHLCESRFTPVAYWGGFGRRVGCPSRT